MALRDTQLAIDRWLRAPEGVAKALIDEDASQAATEVGAAARRLSKMIHGDEALDAVGRLEIYANAYFQRIFGVLQADYPALEVALGADVFYDLITSYLLVEPSRHPSLRYAGARLPTFLMEHDAASTVRRTAPWASDLAHLEWTRSEVFDAEEREVLNPDALATLDPEHFAEIELRLGPWVQRAAYTHPVADLWRPAVRGEAIPMIEAALEPQRLLLWRRQEEPVHRIIQEEEDAALSLAEDGIQFDSLCEFAATRVGESDAPALAAHWLAQWLRDGLLQAS